MSRKRSNKRNKHKNRQLKEDVTLLSPSDLSEWQNEIHALDFVNLAVRIYNFNDDCFTYHGYDQIVSSYYPEYHFILRTAIYKERERTANYWRDYYQRDDENYYHLNVSKA